MVALCLGLLARVLRVAVEQVAAPGTRLQAAALDVLEVVFDSFCLVDLSAPSLRERARKSFRSERERADHPVRPAVVVASVTTIGGQEGNDRRG
mgnify:CR=1 FL=1